MPYKNLELTNAGTVAQSTTKQSHFYKGFSSVGDTSFGTRLYDFELVQQDIINNFNTRKGERVMNPEFGCVIWDLLMEPLTDSVSAQLTEDITAICNSDPRVAPTKIQLTEYDSGYLLELTLVLKGTDQSATLKLTFDQNIGLQIQ
jgi:phage baseplate assembly protein W